MPVVSVNDAELHYELRGSGSPLLLIMGAGGYGGVFERLADLLGDDFTVVTYDRRGNARSPRPVGWEATSHEEQADDAAALLDALGLSPGAVFGTSSGGNYALTMSIRHPEAVTVAILHEPGLFALADDPAAVRDFEAGLVREELEAGRPAEAFERLFRAVATDANWERLDASAQRRMLSSAETYFEYESGLFYDYLPSEEVLGAIAAPVRLLVCEDSLPEFAQVAGRLAPRLGAEIARTPGTHFSYLDHPEELARAVRSFALQPVG